MDSPRRFHRRPTSTHISISFAAAGLLRDELNNLFRSQRKQNILDAITRPAEEQALVRYRESLTDTRIAEGVEFWRENAATLARAEQEYSVPPEIVVAIIGVETRYGRNAGTYRVLDALTTLAFDYPPRSDFFRGELTEFLLLAREEGMDPRSLMGSYAGAMGYGQFIPSSFRNYAVDFDGDGKRNIWTNPKDAIGSVANYSASTAGLRTVTWWNPRRSIRRRPMRSPTRVSTCCIRWGSCARWA
jgi:membrane-bound lytic murein transglycosylase B